MLGHGERYPSQGRTLRVLVFGIEPKTLIKFSSLTPKFNCERTLFGNI